MEPVGDNVCKGGRAGAALKDVAVTWMALKASGWLGPPPSLGGWLSRNPRDAH